LEGLMEPRFVQFIRERLPNAWPGLRA